MLAINQEQPKRALEILPSIDKHFSSINVRALAHSECGQYNEAIEIIENQYKNHKVSIEVVSVLLTLHKKTEINILWPSNFIFSKKQMDRIKANVANSDSTELKSRIDSLLQKMKQGNRIVNRVNEIKFLELFCRVQLFFGWFTYFSFTFYRFHCVQTIDEILCWPISHKLQDYDWKAGDQRPSRSWLKRKSSLIWNFTFVIEVNTMKYYYYAENWCFV